MNERKQSKLRFLFQLQLFQHRIVPVRRIVPMGRKRRQPLSIRGLDFVLAFCYFLLPDGQFYLYANYFIVAGAAEGRKAEQRGGARGGEAGTNPICRLFVKKSHNSSLLAHIFHGGSDVAACRAHPPSVMIYLRRTSARGCVTRAWPSSRFCRTFPYIF